MEKNDNEKNSIKDNEMPVTYKELVSLVNAWTSTLPGAHFRPQPTPIRMQIASGSRPMAEHLSHGM